METPEQLCAEQHMGACWRGARWEVDRSFWPMHAHNLIQEPKHSWMYTAAQIDWPYLNIGVLPGGPYCCGDPSQASEALASSGRKRMQQTLSAWAQRLVQQLCHRVQLLPPQQYCLGAPSGVVLSCLRSCTASVISLWARISCSRLVGRGVGSSFQGQQPIPLWHWQHQGNTGHM